MGRWKAMTRVRIARLAVAAAMAVLALAALLRLVGRRGGRGPDTAIPPGAEAGRAVEVTRGIRHREFVRGELEADIRGDVFVKGEDGWNRLTGSVEVTYVRPSGGTASRATADEVIYDPEGMVYTLRGRVRVEAERARLESEEVVFDGKSRTLSTEKGGAFYGPGLSGRAGSIVYEAEKERVRFARGFSAEVPGAEGSGPLVLSGGSLVYDRAEGRAAIEGRPSLSGQGWRGRAGRLELRIVMGEGAIASAAFLGEASFTFGEGGEASADILEGFFDRENGHLEKAEAKGKARLLWREPSGGSTTIEAGTIDLGFDRTGSVARWSASSAVRAEVEGPGGRRRIEADAASWEASSGVLSVGPGGSRRASVGSEELEIEALSLLIGTPSGRLTAEGDVRGLLKAAAGDDAKGLFGPDGPVFVAAARLVAEASEERLSLEGGARLWSGSLSLSAEAIDLFKRGGGTRARGNVVIALKGGPEAESDDGPVELGGRTLEYEAGEGRLRLAESAYVRLPGIALESGSLEATLLEGREAIEALVAGGGVRVVRAPYEARGEKAVYDARRRKLAVSGRTVLFGAKGVISRGDKLTFDLADDRILVENEGEGRSTTVIKS